MERNRPSDTRTPRLSVVICTRQRDRALAACLESLTRQTLGRDARELIVVDNSPGDPSTRRLAQAFDALYLVEPQLGLARARNRGWQAARGEIIAFIDDDAEASARWLEQIACVFDSLAVAPGCVGGRVEPVWDAPRPDWLGEKLWGTLSMADWSPTPRPIQSGEWLPGCNMAFLRAKLVEYKGFNEKLGRRGAKLSGMEETLLHHRMRERGETLYYHPEVHVRHHVTADRMVPRWFLRRAFWNGVSLAQMQILLEAHSMRRRADRVRRAARNPALGTALFRAGSRELSVADVHAHCVVYGWLGYSLGMLGLAH